MRADKKEHISISSLGNQENKKFGLLGFSRLNFFSFLTVAMYFQLLGKGREISFTLVTCQSIKDWVPGGCTLSDISENLCFPAWSAYRRPITLPASALIEFSIPSCVCYSMSSADILKAIIHGYLSEFMKGHKSWL